jgi:hypothetical protein
VHFGLATLFALIMSLIIASFSLDSSLTVASLAGVVFGIGIYLVNFYGMTWFFPWFADARYWANALAHILFGVMAANAYMRSERKEMRSGEPDSREIS